MFLLLCTIQFKGSDMAVYEMEICYSTELGQFGQITYGH